MYDGVVIIVKYWVGYGVEFEGFDVYNYYGWIVCYDDVSFV